MADQLNQWRVLCESLLEFVDAAPVSSGVCCCGESIEGHASPMYCGHEPVDAWAWALAGWKQEIEALADKERLLDADEQDEPVAFVQEVPDYCDRIVWRGRYYSLPLDRADEAGPQSTDGWWRPDRVPAALLEALLPASPDQEMVNALKSAVESQAVRQKDIHFAGARARDRYLRLRELLLKRAAS